MKSRLGDKDKSIGLLLLERRIPLLERRNLIGEVAYEGLAPLAV